MRIVKCLSFVFILITSSFLNSAAQDKIIRGAVTTFDSIFINGASIKVKSTKQEVFTDSFGIFSVGVANKDVIVVTAKGFYNKKVKLAPNTKFAAINLKLKSDPKSVEYAVGYGYIKEADKLNAISNLNNNDMDFSKYKDIYDLISGRFSGVRVVDGQIIVRGKNTFDNSMSSNAALIIVNGVPENSSILGSIPTDQVKSIDIIKDGSSAIYGVQGANGVVIIETKKGSEESKKR